MLEHTDRRDLVKALASVQVAVVLQAQFDRMFQAERAQSVAAKLKLLPRQGDASGFYLIVQSRVNDQCSPAAANVQQAVTGLQHQFAANQIEFLLLRLFKRFVA